MPASQNCYVTNSSTTIPYQLGDRLLIPLTQESYAHFILRSAKHSVYQQIKKDLDTVSNKLKDLENKHIRCSRTSPDFLENLSYDAYFDVSIEMGMLGDKAQAYLTQVAETSVLIFRSMRDEFKKYGKLS